jgi:hypothetical protein
MVDQAEGTKIAFPLYIEDIRLLFLLQARTVDWRIYTPHLRDKFWDVMLLIRLAR